MRKSVIMYWSIQKLKIIGIEVLYVEEKKNRQRKSVDNFMS